MPHRNLYGVTATLRTLLRSNIWRISANKVDVTDLPPEEAEKDSGTRLNLHLYHAVETPHQRNAFAPDDIGPYPISRMPMPLTLYYALTAHVSTEAGVKIKDQQELMGLGMKSLHDFPMIDDRLEMEDPDAPPNLVKILDGGMRKGQNWIEIVPRPVTPEESLHLWASVQNHTARLTAYYEVRTTLLFPDEPSQTPGIVTAFALGVGSSARPTLLSSSSIQTVTMPALSGGATFSTEISPAVAALGAVAAPAGNHVVLTGEALGDGSDGKLILSSQDIEEAIVDPASNPAWKFIFRGDTLEFDAQPEVNAEAPAGFATIAVRPGLYSIGVLRERQLKTVAGATSLSTVDSNRIAIAVGPRVQSVAVAGGKIEVKLAAGVDCTDVANKLQLAIAGEVYRKVAAPATIAGTFSATATKLTAVPLFDPTDGATRIVRVAVNGVDAQPVWLEP